MSKAAQILDNPRHEAFAHNMAMGLDASMAYVKAGYRDNLGVSASACRLLKNSTIRIRIAQLVANLAEIERQKSRAIESKGLITKAIIIDELLDNARKCKYGDKPDFRSSNQAFEIVAKLQGYVVDKSERITRKSWADFSNDELRALIAEAEQKLTLAAPVDTTCERLPSAEPEQHQEQVQ